MESDGQAEPARVLEGQVAGHLHTAHLGPKLRLLPAVEQLGAEVGSCRAAGSRLRLSLARRSASALKASSYLRRLSGDVPLVLASITEEIFVLLLSVVPGPPHPEQRPGIHHAAAGSNKEPRQCLAGLFVA